MFSLIFPGQGSQIIGMAKEFYDNFEIVKNNFVMADEILQRKLSKIILEGPKEDLDKTENTQPAIFLTSYSIFKVLEQLTNNRINNASYFAGHSLGEYSALCCAKAINFEQTVKLLKHRGKAMQDALPGGEGGMLAILGSEIEKINEILNKNFDNFQNYIANDNSVGQVVISGENTSLTLLSEELKKKNIKFVKLQVSAPFHCPLMKNATESMRNKILETDFKVPIINVISNVTANPENNTDDIKRLLIEQIEKPVRWRESISYMLDYGVNKFIEVGPGKVLSGLVKRIDRNANLNQVNNLEDLKKLSND